MIDCVSKLEIKHLKMVRAIFETSNMTMAAETLFISQSALSQQLKDIETKLGIDLFFRTGKKMVLTPIGKRLLQTADHILETLEEAELDIAKIVSGDKGELKVGTQCLFCFKWLPRVLRLFHDKFPNVEIEIGMSLSLNKDLESKRYDIVISGAPFVDKQFTSQPIFQDQMVCILSNDHPLRFQPFVRFEDFEGISIISHSDKTNNPFYQQALKPLKIEPKRFMTISQPQAIIEMVESGFGVSIVPKWAVQSALEERSICALPVTKKGLPLEWKANFLKNNAAPFYQQEFVNLIARINPTQTNFPKSNKKKTKSIKQKSMV